MLYVTETTKLGEGPAVYGAWPYAFSLHPQGDPGSTGQEGGQSLSVS